MDAESIFLLACPLMFSLFSHPLSDSEPSVCPKAVHSPKSKSNRRKQDITGIEQTKLVYVKIKTWSNRNFHVNWNKT